MPNRVTVTEVQHEIQKAIASAKDKPEVVEALTKLIVFINTPRPLSENQH